MTINHYIKPLGVELENDEYTPSSVITAINDKLTAQNAAKTVIEGICTELSRESYYGYYFGKLVDSSNDGFYIKIKVPEQLMNQMISNTLCELSGYLEKQISSRNDGSISMVFRVAAVLNNKECGCRRKIEKECERMIAAKEKRGRQNVSNIVTSAIRAGRKVNVLIITGEKSVAYTDVVKSIGTAVIYYNIKGKRVNFSNKESICKALNQCEQYAAGGLIAVVRGGGDGLGIFSDIEVLQAAAVIRSSCLVTALGHYEDQPLLDKIADLAFGTPTALGHFLAKSAGIVKRESLQHKMKKSNRWAWFITSMATTGFFILLINQMTRM